MTTPETENQMTTQNTPADEPFFPPVLLLLISALGFVVAFIIAITPGEFSIVGWAGILVGIIALIFWGIMNPKDLLNFVQGRGLAFGGTAIVVSLVVIVASVLIYMVIERQNWVLDVTEGNVLTIAENTREVLETLANDPTAGSARFIGFFTTQNAAGQERVEILLREFETISGGKITYQFVDPDRDPLMVQQFTETVRNGQIAVVPYDVNGQPLYEEAELVSSPDQYTLTNTVIAVLAAGDFRAIFLNVPEGVDPTDSTPAGSNFWPTYLQDTLDWTVEIMSPLELTTTAGLGEMASDGDVLIIPGGVDALPDETIAAIQTYANAGGNIVLLAGLNLGADPTLAAAANMSSFLQEVYGISVRNDIVVDDEMHFNIQALQLVSDVYTSHPVTGTSQEQGLIAFFAVPQSIEISDPTPAGVTITPLISTTENGYTKADLDINTILEQAEVTIADFEALFAQAEGDLAGEIPVAVAAENSTSGSRIVVFGSDAIIWNSADGSRGESNPFLMQGAIFWTTGYDEFAASLSTVRPLEEEVPDQVLVSQSDALYIRLVTVFLIPFGSLLLGVAIWWLRRDKVVA